MPSYELMTNPNGGFSTELPIGTVEEVERAGLDPTKVRCCGFEKKGNPNLICKAAGACRFHRASYGGFQGKAGPQLIAVEIITGDTLADGEPVVQQMEIPCHLWATKWQKRADFGRQQIEDNKPGELISIIGFQGDMYESRIQMPINVNGEVIKQSRHMYETLEKYNPEIKFNRDDRREAHSYEMFNIKQRVENHPRPGERKASSYSQRMLEKTRARLAEEREVEDAVIKLRRQPSEADIDSVVKRGPGRPRKVEAVTAEPSE